MRGALAEAEALMDDLGADWEHEELMLAKGRAACARSVKVTW